MKDKSRNFKSMAVAMTFVLFAMLLTPQAIAKTCNSLLLMVGGANSEPSIDKPVLKPLVDYLKIKYQGFGIDIDYFAHELLKIKDVHKMARSRIQKHREQCPEASIGVLGYSWGGDSAYKIAETSETRIQALVTLDPVSLLTNPNPTRYRGGLFWFNNLILLGSCAATLAFPPIAAVVCSATAGLILLNIGVKITTEMLDNGNVPNPANVDIWIHIWAPGSRDKWDDELDAVSDAFASFGAWLEQEHPDVKIRSDVSHNDLCNMYRESEKKLLQKLANNVSAAESAAKRWDCKMYYRHLYYRPSH